jgi:hypothetical protein
VRPALEYAARRMSPETWPDRALLEGFGVKPVWW